MTILVDTGVLVALVDPDTREHIWIRTCQHVDGWTDVHKWPAPAPRSTKRRNPKPEARPPSAVPLRRTGNPKLARIPGDRMPKTRRRALV